MSRNIKRKGFITLEAAIFLPIFIIGILTIGYLMKFIYAQENILYSICDESKLVSKNAYIIKVAPLHPNVMENRLERENPDIAFVETEKFRYLYSENGLDGLIQYKANYWMKIKFPIKLYDGFSGSETVVYRGLVGAEKISAGLSFEEMEKEKRSVRVWVFPTAGVRYHKRSCPYIAVMPMETILTKDIKKKYHSCPVCEAKKLQNGSLIYCFYKHGEAYHTGKCPTVDKYVVELEKETAIKKGYSPCKVCGGSE